MTHSLGLLAKHHFHHLPREVFLLADPPRSMPEGVLCLAVGARVGSFGRSTQEGPCRSGTTQSPPDPAPGDGSIQTVSLSSVRPGPLNRQDGQCFT